MFSGGFTNSGGGTPTGSQDGGRDRSKRTSYGLSHVPFLISDLHKCVTSDGTCRLLGEEVSSVTLVGRVRSVDVTSMNYKYMLDDMSGEQMEVLQWLDGPSGGEKDSEPTMPPLMTNTYARICGAPRITDDKVFIVAFKSVRLVNLSYLTMHLLETVHVKKIVRGFKASNSSSSLLSSYQSHVSAGSSLTGGTSAAGGKASAGDMKRQMQLIGEVVQMYTDEVGCPLSTIFEKVKLSRTLIIETIKFMSDEGHVYTTKDEEHFKLTSI